MFSQVFNTVLHACVYSNQLFCFEHIATVVIILFCLSLNVTTAYRSESEITIHFITNASNVQQRKRRQESEAAVRLRDKTDDGSRRYRDVTIVTASAPKPRESDGIITATTPGWASVLSAQRRLTATG